MTIQKPREIAVRALERRESNANFIENTLDALLTQSPMSPADRRLAQELAFGVARWQRTLDWLIERRTQGRPQKLRIQILLRLGLYQILWLDRIPEHAAVHETVELAKRLGLGPQSGFINAILRTYLREKDDAKKSLEELKKTDPALAFSHPAWIYDRWEQRWGVPDTLRLLEWNNTPPKTYARVNTLRTDAGKLLEQWRDEDVSYDFLLRDWTGENLVFVLKQHPPLRSLKSFLDGLFYVQDPSTLLSVRILDPQPGERILDLCAAPGGKTTFIAQCMQNEGRVVALDADPARLDMIRENCTRLGVTCVETALATTGALNDTPLFDRALVDAPCSNTGVMRRRVDSRWRLTPQEIDRLRTTQLELLKGAGTRLKPGGTLVYSTCSMEPEENRALVRQFLLDQPAFQLEQERDLLPFRDGVDGAYVARLARVFDA